MRTRNRRIALTGAMVVLPGCGILEPGAQEFLIRSDSVAAPATAPASAALQVRVYGPVGPDACHRFKRFHVERSATAVDVSLLGEKVGGTCAQMPVYLDGELLEIAPPLADPFTIRIQQPDGSRLTKTVRGQ